MVSCLSGDFTPVTSPSPHNGPVKENEAQRTGGACTELHSREAAELLRKPESCVFSTTPVSKISSTAPALRKQRVRPPHATGEGPQHPGIPGLRLVKGLEHPFITWGPIQREEPSQKNLGRKSPLSLEFKYHIRHHTLESDANARR